MLVWVLRIIQKGKDDRKWHDYFSPKQTVLFFQGEEVKQASSQELQDVCGLGSQLEFLV